MSLISKLGPQQKAPELRRVVTQHLAVKRSRVAVCQREKGGNSVTLLKGQCKKPLVLWQKERRVD